MLRTLSFMIVTACMLFATACDKSVKKADRVEIPESVKELTAEHAKDLVAPHLPVVKKIPVVDLSRFPNLEKLKAPAFVNDQWPRIVALDTSVRTRPRPDFTDIGVSQLFTNLRDETSEVMGCHLGAMRSFLESAGTATFIASHPLDLRAECYVDWMFWNHSANQRQAWSRTAPELRESFLVALATYHLWAQTNPEARCVIEGLNFESANSNPYTNVAYGPALMPDGSQVWYIQLRQPLLYDIEPM